MIIDLEQFRPQNESFEHFFLKQIGRAYLFDLGIRCIATEVSINGLDVLDFGTRKIVIDVIGIDKRSRRDDLAKKIQNKIEEKALEIGFKSGIAEESKWGFYKYSWKFSKNKQEQKAIEKQIEMCRNEACESFGYKSYLWRHIGWAYQDVYQIRGIEVKVSYSDFRNGFCIMPEYTYVLAPKGIVPVNELPKKVGLLEFDFDGYYKAAKPNWRDYLSVTKNARKQYDSYFKENKNGREVFSYAKHAEYCMKLLFDIAYQNTKEHIYWNPHIKQIEKGYRGDIWDRSFSFKIGDETNLGIVIDRRVNQNREKFYKLVKVGEGLTGWISENKLRKI
jgi:hypothetical protein